jgi:hypothetical protein
MHACLTVGVVPSCAVASAPLLWRFVMILAVAAVLAVLWVLGVVAFHVTAFAIHLLLIAAVIALIAHFVVGRRSGRTRV